MPVTLSGLASGLDTTSIVAQLVQADSGNLTQLQQKSADTASANKTITQIGTSLSSLAAACAALSDATANGSFTATSSDTNIAVTAQSNAQPGTYAVQVKAVAQSQRTYSASFASATSALNQSGSFTIAVGAGSPATINVAATDSLQNIVSKINGAGLQVAASIFNDGTTSRLQIRGIATGAANTLTFAESGTTLDLNGTGGAPTSGKTVQVAQDAHITVDGFDVTRPTNQIADAVSGLSIQVTNPTAAAATVTVAADPSTLTTNLNAVVTAYNAIIAQIHIATGYGAAAASNKVLAGDTMLRSIASNLSMSMQATSAQSGSLKSLADVGLALQKDGTIALDSAKLSKSFSTDPLSVQNLLGRLHNSTTGGLLANVADTVNKWTASDGNLASREQSLTKQASDYDSRAVDEQTRLAAYQTQLQKQFSAMETTYSQNQTLLAQVSKL